MRTFSDEDFKRLRMILDEIKKQVNVFETTLEEMDKREDQKATMVVGQPPRITGPASIDNTTPQ